MSLTPAVLEARVVKAEAVDEPVLLLPGEARDLLGLLEASGKVVSLLDADSFSAVAMQGWLQQLRAKLARFAEEPA